ncbi:hypothetical protein B1H58_15375 [Pantoea alhagi]|uniref:Uncharacterized protein n=1 Tax=Pantoea alhagi TaxID=1891675 RepID=A0A1W6B881_9GAMM|nr:hypothetical protein [Pantoea alhagi]ARJ43277.1 hypothetical protein B1H58_15375 [Pantoea alhagi]
MTPSQKRLFEALKNNQGTYVIDENGFIHVTGKAMREAVANFRFPAMLDLQNFALTAGGNYEQR